MIIVFKTSTKPFAGNGCRMPVCPGVENAFAPGSVCEQLYAEACHARDRVCQRLGSADEDPDLEEIFRALLDIAHGLSVRMYCLGRTLQVPLE